MAKRDSGKIDDIEIPPRLDLALNERNYWQRAYLGALAGGLSSEDATISADRSLAIQHRLIKSERGGFND